MGLDSYFYEKILRSPEEFPEHCLCGGMFSGNKASFRGKVYDEFVHDITGESLYVVEGDQDYVETIATGLEEANITKDTLEKYNIFQEEIDDLRKIFRYAADNKLTYQGWW